MTTTTSKDLGPESETAPMSMREFLENVPPGAERDIVDINVADTRTGALRLNVPQLRLHCGSPECGGARHFVSNAGVVAAQSVASKTYFFLYYCRNCSRTSKTYAIRVSRPFEPDGHEGRAIKFGELPAFGPPIPPSVFRLTGQDREIFLRGRRAENQGLGLGALAYYRRVVEDEWKRLLAEILKVATKLEVPEAQLETLRAAQAERLFSKAVDKAKDSIPSSLLIDGHHNPLTLLHAALSEDIHAGSEERCLELARVVRAVLFDLSERLASALEDRAELRRAVSALLNREPAPPTANDGSVDPDGRDVEPNEPEDLRDSDGTAYST